MPAPGRHLTASHAPPDRPYELCCGHRHWFCSGAPSCEAPHAAGCEKHSAAIPSPNCCLPPREPTTLRLFACDSHRSCEQPMQCEAHSDPGAGLMPQSQIPKSSPSSWPATRCTTSPIPWLIGISWMACSSMCTRSGLSKGNQQMSMV